MNFDKHTQSSNIITIKTVFFNTLRSSLSLCSQSPSSYPQPLATSDAFFVPTDAVGYFHSSSFQLEAKLAISN